MKHVAVRIRELVSSNLDALLTKAEDKRKMLRLLETEVEEALIALHADLAKAERAHKRQKDTASRLSQSAESWTAKAKTAVDHGREDLARAALLARESERKQSDEAKAEVKKCAAEVGEIKSAIADLEAKREDVSARVQEERQVQGEKAPTAPTTKDNRTAKQMDRIEALDRRTSFAGDDAAALDPQSVEAEIASLSKESAIEAELAAMKKPAAKRSRKKAK